VIYLDNAATSWPKPESVYQAVEQTIRNAGNAGRGANTMSLAASRILVETRMLLAELFNIPNSERIVFTQNVTEALNLALKGTLNAGDHVVISPYEHNSVVRVLEYLRVEVGITYTIAPCHVYDEEDAQFNSNNYTESVLAAFESSIKPNTKMLCVTHASNVLGTILPIHELGRLAKSYNLLFLVDAAQTAGIIPIDAQAMEIDLLAFTGHKGLLGPQGTGGLYVKKDVLIKPLIHGGTGSRSAKLSQPDVFPDALESGTRNLAGIAGLAAGVRYCLEHITEIRSHEILLLDKLLAYLQQQPHISIYGPTKATERVGLIAFNASKMLADELGYVLENQYNIATRTGLHCSPLAHASVSTIDQGAIRVSVGPFTTESEIDQLIAALGEIIC